jgi:hypothetical protein
MAAVNWEWQFDWLLLVLNPEDVAGRRGLEIFEDAILSMTDADEGKQHSSPA